MEDIDITLFLGPRGALAGFRTSLRLNFCWI